MQLDALTSAGVDPRDIFQEKASGASVEKRPEFRAMMKDCQEGDVVYVWKLDRLARNVLDLHETAQRITAKGARLVVLTLPGMDTGTPVGQAMFGMLAVFAEFERAIAYERTMAGLKAARERGRVGGRNSPVTDEQVLATKGMWIKAAMDRLGYTTQSGYKKRLAKALADQAKEPKA